MLGILALLMFVAAGLTSCFDASWSTWQVLLVAVLVSASVFSWHGVTWPKQLGSLHRQCVARLQVAYYHLGNLVALFCHYFIR